MESIRSKKVATIKRRTKSNLEMLSGVGVKGAQLLRHNGIPSIANLASTPIESLKTIPGIGPKTAEKYLQSARNYMNQSALTHYMKSLSSEKDENENNEEHSDDYLKEMGGELVELSQEELNNEKEEWQPDIEGYYRDENEIKSTINDNHKIERDNKEPGTVLANNPIPEQRKHPAVNEKMVINNNDPDNDKPFQALPPLKMEQNLRTKEGQPNLKRPLTPLQAEKLVPSELKNIISDIEVDLKTLDYWILKADQKHHASLLKNVDLLALRSFVVSDFLELVILIPIKVSQGKGKHRVYEEEIRYAPANRKKTLNAAEKRLLIDGNVEILKMMRENIFKNIIKKGSMFQYLARFLNKDLSIEKSLTRKELFLTSGHIYHEIITCPVLVMDGEVEFLENRMAPFAWQRNVSIHFINKDDVRELVQYLEKKHVLVETHAVKKNLIDEYLEMHDRLYSRLRYFALPFTGYAGLLLFIALMNPQVLGIFFGIGMGLVSLFIIGVGLILFSLLNAQRALHEKYKIPYYQRPLEIDETGIVLINEELPQEWMHQFIYEADMNTKQLETTRNIETEGLRTHLEKSPSFSPPELGDDEDDEEAAFHNQKKNDNLFRSRPSMAQKYHKFMEE